MKTIKLVSLTMINFKGEKERTTHFNADVTTISGANGYGKSRHFDAFIWALFGKDVADRKDYEIKTRINGEELHKAECSVTVVLDVDGETITLKRAIVEDWVKPRGQVEQRYKSNHTECWWNETPVNVTEYDKRVAAIVDASVFKMVTNPAFFAGMKWQLQREQLFALAGDITDQDIAGDNPEFNALLDAISGKSLADYKKEIAAVKKRLNNDLGEIQPRIDQTLKVMPAAVDFEGIRSNIAAIDANLANIDEQISDKAARTHQEYKRQRELAQQIDALKREMQQMVFDEQTAAQKAAFEAGAKAREIKAAIDDAEMKAATHARRGKEASEAVERTNANIAALTAKQEKLRSSWFDVNAEEYAGETTCPHCGQPLPADMIDRARDIFNNEKAARLAKITDEGKHIGELIAAEQKVIAERNAFISECHAGMTDCATQAETLRAELAALPPVNVAEVVPEDIPGYTDKAKAVADLEQQTKTETTPADTTALQQRKREMLAERDELIASLRAEDEITRCKKVVADLEAEGKQLAQQIADIERSEYNVQQFTAAKVNECERRINGMFRYVTFRLFDYTLEGNPVETCVPLIKGVPYGAANTAAKVNAGLDIIHALCRHYNVCAPIFIDNRESVNEIVEMESQIINLVATMDKKLTIN